MLPTEGRGAERAVSDTAVAAAPDDAALDRLRRAVYAPDGGEAALARYRDALSARTPRGAPDRRSVPAAPAEAPANGPTPWDALEVDAPLAAPVAAVHRRRVAALVVAAVASVAVVGVLGAALMQPRVDPLARPTLAPNDSVVSDRQDDIAAAHDFVRSSVHAPIGSEPVDFFNQRGLARPGTGRHVLQIAATERHLSASGRVGLGLLAPAAVSHGSVLVLCDRPATFSWRIDTGSTTSAAPTAGPAATPVIRSSGSCGAELVASTFDVTGGTLLTAMTLTLPRGTHAVVEVAVTD